MKSKMIDANALLKMYAGCEDFHMPVEIIIQNIKDMPTYEHGNIVTDDIYAYEDVMMEPKCKNCKHIKSKVREYWTDKGKCDITNCPNCGAPINSDVCEYCGTNLSKHRRVYSYTCDMLLADDDGKTFVVTDNDYCEMFIPKEDKTNGTYKRRNSTSP